jgi:hypothetical protein
MPGFAPFTSVSTGFSFARGVGVLERGSVVTQSYYADITGWVGLLDGTLALNGTLNTGGPGAEDGTQKSFTVEGTLKRPIARPLALAN